jgi:catechol 2,3-dioxygenase-like lactoylglutathione lyase family enzyme
MPGALVANLKVPDLDQAIAFYEGGLGLTVADRRSLMPGHEDVVFQAGCATICVEVGEGGRSDTPISFEVDDVEVTVGELRERGIVPEEYDLRSLKAVDGIATLGEMQAAWVKDPGGNLVGIVTRVRTS